MGHTCERPVSKLCLSVVGDFNILSIVCAVLTTKTSLVYAWAVQAAVQRDVIEDYVGGRAGCEAEEEGDWLHDS